MPLVFSDRERLDARPSSGESMYTFLDRAAGPVWDRTRQLIENWASAFADHGPQGSCRTRYSTTSSTSTAAPQPPRADDGASSTASTTRTSRVPAHGVSRGAATNRLRSDTGDRRG